MGLIRRYEHPVIPLERIYHHGHEAAVHGHVQVVLVGLDIDPGEEKSQSGVGVYPAYDTQIRCIFRTPLYLSVGVIRSRSAYGHPLAIELAVARSGLYLFWKYSNRADIPPLLINMPYHQAAHLHVATRCRESLRLLYETERNHRFGDLAFGLRSKGRGFLPPTIPLDSATPTHFFTPTNSTDWQHG